MHAEELPLSFTVGQQGRERGSGRGRNGEGQRGEEKGGRGEVERIQ